MVASTGIKRIGEAIGMTPIIRTSLRCTAAALGAAASGYLTYVAVTWSRYGKTARPNALDHDHLLDRFMPTYEVVERHHIHVAAPAAVTLAVARDTDLLANPAVRAIISRRELLLGARRTSRARPAGLLAEMQSLGWVVLAEIPEREIVVGAVTRPWEANVTFHSVPPSKFARFNTPDYVKIAWTLRADPVDATSTVFRTETRAAATDALARAKFRRYWSWLSPGIVLIRLLMLRGLKQQAESRAKASVA